MLIRCGKCGKMYDYEKYNGICPKCARYNRLDSREDMEQRLHDRYDAQEQPHQHDWYRETQLSGEKRKTSDSFNDYEKSGRRNNTQRQTGDEKTGSHVKLLVRVVVIVIICAAIGIIAGSTMLFSGIKSTIEDGWNVNNQGYDQAEEEIDPEYQNRIFVDYAWAEYLGDDLSEVNWDSYSDDYFLEVTEAEKRELSELKAEEGDTYYIVSLDIQNNLSDMYNLSYLTEKDVRIYTEEEAVSAEDDGENDCIVEKVFTINYPETESGDSNYVDVLVKVPDELEKIYGSCLLNGSQETFECYLYE